MAHSSLHLGLGILTGTTAFVPLIIHRIRSGRKLAPIVAKCLIASYGLGTMAILPGIMMRLGLPPAFGTGWWMNLFFLHPLIDKLKNGGMLVGESAIIISFLIQYSIIILLLARTLRKNKAAASQ